MERAPERSERAPERTERAPERSERAPERSERAGERDERAYAIMFHVKQSDTMRSYPIALYTI